ncbi:Uncharacterised protein [Klebsiella aerogenes]|nr:Uncharacterised protein [Klebsiella aerogenes]
MQCYKAAFILSLLFCPFLASAAGVAIAGTRVIYNEQSHEADITGKKTPILTIRCLFKAG